MGYSLSTTCFGAVLAVVVATTPAAAGEARSYDMPSQPLGAAIRSVAFAAGRNVTAPSALLAGKIAPPLKGQFDADAAIDALLLGSGLRARLVGDALVIGPEGPIAASNEVASGDEILVTGTRIRGAAPAGSALTIIDRAEIERSGYATTQLLLQSLPQNYGGGPNETTGGVTTRNLAGSNNGYGASLNLRGLGSTSTLVLFNGNRPPLGGLSGAFADLSMVPSTAVERIELLANGASAIYGSDAVAGVVNIRFRSRFEGAETRLRYGLADGFDERQASQLLGTRWASGGAMLAYEYYDRSNLAARKRAFATEDLRPFGDPDFRLPYGSPGTIIAGGRTFGIPAGQNGVGLTAARLLPGVTNFADQRAASDLLPSQKTHSLFGAAHQALGERGTLYAEGLFARRAYSARTVAAQNALTVPVSNPFYVDPVGTRQPVRVQYSFARDLGAPLSHGTVLAYSGVLGLTRTFGDWSADIHAAHGRQRELSRTDNVPNTARIAAALADTNPATSLNVFGDGPNAPAATLDRIRGSNEVRNRYVVSSAVAKADGPLFEIAGGSARAAIGAEYRVERYNYTTRLDTRTLVAAAPASLPGLPGPRHISAAYGELFLPLVGTDNGMTLLQSLELSIAGRIERYSDVGTTRNPKVGLSWSPARNVVARGTYGRSFRAPGFTDLVGSALANYQPLIVNDPASPTGQSRALGLYGYAPDIGPERATTWTAGVEVRPSAAVRVSLDYYDVAYRDRIGTATQDVFNFLSNRAVYGGLVTDNPSAAVVAAYYASPSFNNTANIPASQIVAILDARARNLSSLHQTGLDLDASLALPVAGGDLSLGAAGSLIFHVNQRLTSAAPVVDVVGTLSNPNGLRLRGRAAWSGGRLDLAAFVNFIDGYDNRLVTPVATVSSWTTVDAQIAYRFAQAGALGGIRIAFNASNLFDRDPPYAQVRTTTSATGYDPDQASPVGRMVLSPDIADLVIALLAAGAAVALAGPTPRELVEVVDLSSLALSPDGSAVAFRSETPSVDRNSSGLAWFVATLAAGSVREVGGGGIGQWSDAGVARTEPPQWARDGQAFYYRALVDDAVQLWRASPGGGSPTAITSEDADILSFSLAPDGRSLRYAFGASLDEVRRSEKSAYDGGVLVDRSVDLAQGAIGGTIVGGRRATQRFTGDWFLRTGLLAGRSLRYRRIGLPAGGGAASASEPSPAPTMPETDPGPLSATGDRIVLVQGFTGGLTVHRTTGAEIACPVQVCGRGRLQSAVWRPGHDEVLLTTSDQAHAQTLSLWSVSRGTARVVARTAGLLNGGRRPADPCAVSARYAICVAASAASPPRLERVDLQSGARLALYDPNLGLRAHQLKVESLAWASASGERFTGTLFPAGMPGRRPLFVTYYSCDGYLRGGLGDEWPLASLAAEGIAALCINAPALTPETEAAPIRYKLAGDAVVSAIDLLDRQGRVDRRRVGMGGLSFGTEAALWVATNTDLLAAVSIASLAVEPSYYWFNSMGGRDITANLKRIWGLGAPDETPAQWGLVSPALNASRLRAPLLMQLPEQEARLSSELYGRLSRSTTPVELYAFPDEPHIKVQPRHKLAAYQRNLDWFRFWLSDEVDPDPAKAPQFMRWRALAARRQRLASPAARVPD